MTCNVVHERGGFQGPKTTQMLLKPLKPLTNYKKKKLSTASELQLLFIFCVL